jgi:hypothetical protein
MNFTVGFLSFFVIQVDGKDGQGGQTYKHYATMDDYDYEESDVKKFLDGEFAQFSKCKVEKNPSTEQAPTKIGRFIVEPEHDLSSKLLQPEQFAVVAERLLQKREEEAEVM